MVAVHSVLFLALLGFTGHSASEVDSGQVLQRHYSINSESQFDVKESFLQNNNNSDKRKLQLNKGKNENSFIQETEKANPLPDLQMRTKPVVALIRGAIVDEDEAEEAVQFLKDQGHEYLVYRLAMIGMNVKPGGTLTSQQQEELNKAKEVLKSWKQQKMPEQEHRRKFPSPVGKEGLR